MPKHTKFNSAHPDTTTTTAIVNERFPSRWQRSIWHWRLINGFQHMIFIYIRRCVSNEACVTRDSFYVYLARHIVVILLSIQWAVLICGVVNDQGKLQEITQFSEKYLHNSVIIAFFCTISFKRSGFAAPTWKILSLGEHRKISVERLRVRVNSLKEKQEVRQSNACFEIDIVGINMCNNCH